MKNISRLFRAINYQYFCFSLIVNGSFLKRNVQVFTVRQVLQLRYQTSSKEKTFKEMESSPDGKHRASVNFPTASKSFSSGYGHDCNRDSCSNLVPY